jgi:hypothetical protein
MLGKICAGFEKTGGVCLRSHNPRQAVLRLADLDGAVAASVRSDTTGTAARRTSQSEEKQAGP